MSGPFQGQFLPTTVFLCKDHIFLFLCTSYQFLLKAGISHNTLWQPWNSDCPLPQRLLLLQLLVQGLLLPLFPVQGLSLLLLLLLLLLRDFAGKPVRPHSLQLL